MPLVFGRKKFGWPMTLMLCWSIAMIIYSDYTGEIFFTRFAQDKRQEGKRAECY
jgi:hypothetical protein